MLPRKVDSPVEGDVAYVLTRRKLPLLIRLQRWFYMKIHGDY